MNIVLDVLGGIADDVFGALGSERREDRKVLFSFYFSKLSSLYFIQFSISSLI